MIADEVSRGIVGKGLVHGAVETACFVDVAVQGVRVVAEGGHCVYLGLTAPLTLHRPGPAMQLYHRQEHTFKVVCLALHGAEAADLPEELVDVPR